MKLFRRLALSFVLAAAAVPATAAMAADTIKLWIHGGRGAAETDEIRRAIETWNQKNPGTPAEVTVLDKDFADKMVQSQALAGAWPDILDFDGPNYANAAWAGLLAPLDDLLPRSTIDGLLPSIIAQGTYAPDGKLYVAGQFDSGLGIWGSREALEKAGIRIPRSVEDAWSLDEFEDALAKLKASGFPTPLDVKLNYGEGEWFTYGFLPLVQSFGGDVINRSTWRAEGTINGDATVAALTHLQSWSKRGYLVPATAGDDAFYGAKRTAALALVGHWMWPAHSAALGSDLVLLPMPTFGEHHVTGMGSWNWGIWSGSARKEAAGRLLDFLLSEEMVKSMSVAAGAIPAVQSVASASAEFAPGGPMAIYAAQLQTIASPRPGHPAYPVISAAFASAVADIIAGEDPKRVLDRAAAIIDQEIDQTDGYAPFGG